MSDTMAERAARAICWADTCESGSCLNAGQCMAENLNATFFRDARAALEASHHAELVEALREISLGLGEFNRDPLIHAENTIESMKKIAADAIAKIGARS